MSRRAAVSRTTIEILERLVGFDTTSHKSNLPMIEWIGSYLADHGGDCIVLPDVTGEKANLIARFGPPASGGVVLCGHADVVPVDGQAWTRDPFVLTRERSRLYGRGTADMKGFIASALAAAPRLAAAPLATPITIALTHDEEVGCLGAPALAAALQETQPMPAAVIVGEPTSMRVVRAHKGIRALRTTITGSSGHSSRPDQASSAVTAAARLIAFIDELAESLASHRLRSDRFEPPYTTINVGTVAGGTAVNVVPATCVLTWEYRSVPGEQPDRILDKVAAFAAEILLPMRRAAPDAAITTETLADIPPLDPAGNAAAAALLQSLGVAEGEPVAYATDGAVLQAAGLPAVLCGPGSMTRGHQPDEYLDAADLLRCDALMTQLAQRAVM